MNSRRQFYKYFFGIIFALTIIVFVVPTSKNDYSRNDESLHYEETEALEDEILERVQNIQQEQEKRSHVSTPERVRAIYMSSWIGGEKGYRSALVDFIDSSSINALVLDIKDYSGFIAFDVDNSLIDSYGTDSNRIRDVKEFLDELHNHNIYVIGRVTVFQDPLLSKARPDLAFKRVDNGEVWKDDKGLAFLNPREKDVWEYIATVAEESYALGFDEINFDYIRYPSDGNMKNLNYGLATGELRTDVMRSFYTFLDERLRTQNIPISADLFGMTTTNEDDLSIGQDIEDALVHFDFIAPMVYPSHYPKTFLGYNNPAEHPYEIVFHAMNEGGRRAEVIGESRAKLRTWIQDFNLGATYGYQQIQDQIRASYDAGVSSYMVWDPKNRYTKNAYTVDDWEQDYGNKTLSEN